MTVTVGCALITCMFLEMTVTGNESTKRLHRQAIVPKIFPRAVVGYRSPKPVVGPVTITYLVKGWRRSEPNV